MDDVLKKRHVLCLSKEEKVVESHGASGEARSLLSGLVSNMLHSPISWASVYLADQV